MTIRAATRLSRCCPNHRDWASLARHLLADFADVPLPSVLDELARAKHATEFFELEQVDALDCAELMVRHRVLDATGHAGASCSSVGTASTTAIARVA